ncbi:alpha/beta hydrolase [Cytobacillus massiliigabonensis]|uniref:alpha/beta hydrolase n=1 Tax=Cytobacillus massiliigabonensis TaxID=1871011 RepID=UPI000C83E391|nr:alpha/beta hydrolase [Cytobacillus massiliigabonensis]
MKTTFIYKEVDGCKIKGDFYAIEEKHAPLIVYIHGGGLIFGTRTDMKEEQINLYLQAGYNVCTIDYRLAPESELTAIKQDIEDALIWLKEQGAGTFGFDPDRMAVIGSSAGGYLALLSGTFQVRPNAIVSFYGYGDIAGDWSRQPSPYFSKMTAVPEVLVHQLIQKEALSEGPIERRFAIYLYCRQQGKWIDYLTGNKEEAPDVFCPLKKIDKNYPPTLLLHGDADDDVPYEQSVFMREALNGAGIKNKLITIENGKHSFDENMKDPAVAETFKEVLRFLKESL